MSDQAQRAARDLLSTGHSMVRLDEEGRRALVELFRAVERFFVQEPSRKARHAGPDFHFGFRAFGRQYSAAPQRPDLNESFTYWANDPQRIPRWVEIEYFIEPLRDFWLVAVKLAEAILDALAEGFGSRIRVAIERSSYIETNWYRAAENRDLLQDRHEDGHLLTFVSADAPGLEVVRRDGIRAVEFADDEVMVMAGSLLTHMTGGAIAPQQHQVRNLGLVRRSSVLFLVNPPFDEPTAPFVVNSSNEGVDIAHLAKSNGAAFGLPEAPSI